MHPDQDAKEYPFTDADLMAMISIVLGILL
jgi:hypothetical protein